MISRIVSLMNEKGVSAYKLTKELDLSNSAITDWKKGKAKPSMEAIVKIADYFNISIDELLGRTTPAVISNSHNNISGNNNIIGNGNSVRERLSEQEKALLDIFKKLNVIKQAQLLAYAAELEKEV